MTTNHRTPSQTDKHIRKQCFIILAANGHPELAEKLISIEMPRSKRYCIFGLNKNQHGWSISMGHLCLSWNCQEKYRELRVQWVSFRDALWSGWDKTIWRGNTPEWIEK